MLSECIQGEWLFKADRGHVYEVMHDLAWHGDTLIPLVKGTLLELLAAGDPSNTSILRYALTMLFADKEPPITKLAGIAEKRIRSYPLGEPGFILWMAVWLQLDAQPALIALEEMLNHSADLDQIMLRLCTALSGEYRDRCPLVPKPSYLSAAALHTFIPLVYGRIRPGDDVERTGGGAYTPEERDHAQNYRNGLLSRLSTSEDSEATTILRELTNDPVMASRRDWILHLLDERIEREADLPPWTPDDIRSFAKEHEIDPKTDRDLFKIACKRLTEIKNDVEKSDNSLPEELRLGDEEPKLRRWLARKLSDRSRNRYTVPQEEEIDQSKKPDLRLENPRTDPLSLEMKWADKWSLTVLLERLENQLVGQYLHAHKSRYPLCQYE